jgi:hypothetical protein
MPTLLDDKDWEQLIRNIKKNLCTPFLGAGMSYGLLPLGGDIAKKWAAEYQYPMADSDDLIKVSQYVSVEQSSMSPKDELVQQFQDAKVEPNFKDVNQPHRVLAELPLTTYITTNYDDFMERALSARHRDPKVELCRWNSLLEDRPSIFDESYKAHPATPVVFHLHGYQDDPYSLVLTEDDYYTFLVNISRKPDIIPRPIEDALKKTSLLFIGYRLADWNFRVLQQSLTRFMEGGLQRNHVAVMLPPPALEGQEERAKQYWRKYYEKMKVTVCWATAAEFLTELRARYEAAQ